ncbi:hypothetical protein SB444474_2060 [Shigella boydii 4444-74]|uniref:Uncharacterized protein n=1 Tax=Shigella boydii 4444-74 TaxID=766140 RepID=I6E434_SHIBO|nr:hypothetical protein SB444474_2060 [Shigella boydii 4444-74]
MACPSWAMTVASFSEFWVMAVPVAVCIRTISSMMPCMVASSGMICRVTG